MKVAIFSVILFGLSRSALGSTPPSPPQTTSRAQTTTVSSGNGTSIANTTIYATPTSYFPCVFPTSILSTTAPTAHSNHTHSPWNNTAGPTTYDSASSTTGHHDHENWGTVIPSVSAYPTSAPVIYCPPYYPNGTQTIIPTVISTFVGNTTVTSASASPTANNTGGNNTNPQNLNDDKKPDSARASVSLGLSGAALAVLFTIALI